MSLPETLRNVRSVHGYAAVVALGIAFTAIGFLSHVQLVIVTLFFGFVALIDSLEDLSRSIDRVYGQLERVNGQLVQVNDDDQANTRDRDRDSSRNR